MTQLATALEAATYTMGITDEADLEDAWVAQANILLQMISADIEVAAGVPLEFGTGTDILPGNWSRDLVVSNGPVRDVSFVSVDGVELAASGYVFNDRRIIRRGVAPFDSINTAGDYDVGRAGANGRSGTHWGGPFATVRVTYSWGIVELGPSGPTVPDFLKSLCLRIFARTVGNVSDITQESLAIYSVTYSNRGTDDGGSHVRTSERKHIRRLLNVMGGSFDIVGR